jgi:hypothetical protein
MTTAKLILDDEGFEILGNTLLLGYAIKWMERQKWPSGDNENSASRLMEEIVGRLLNHTPISITGQRYTRPSLEALRPSMEIACAELSRRMSS